MDNPFDFFEEIYCINLDHRTDRWGHAQEEFEKLGIKDRVKRFSAIKHNDGRIGLIKSNLKIVKDVKKRNLKNVLIFEDDVKILWKNNPMETLSAALSQLNSDWDMFYLGANTHRKLIKINKNLILLKFAYATQSISFNSKVYDKFIEYAENTNQITNMAQILDVWISRNIQETGKVYMTNPMITTQLDSFSDIENRVVNYGYIEQRFNNNIK